MVSEVSRAPTAVCQVRLSTSRPYIPLCDLPHTAHLSRRNRHIGRPHPVIGHDWVDCFDDLRELPAKASGEHIDRFQQANVPRNSACDIIAKLVERQARTDLLLQARAALSRIHHARHSDAADVDTWGSQKQW